MARPSNATVRYGGDATVTVGGIAAASDARVIDAGEALYVLHQGRQ